MDTVSALQKKGQAGSGTQNLNDFLLSLWIASVVEWSEFLATHPEVSVSIPGADFLRSIGSETGSTQPREYNRRATWKK
jgi:hypothetical protein